MSSICCAHGDYPQNDDVFNYVNGTTQRPGTPLTVGDDEHDDGADDVSLGQCGCGEHTGADDEDNDDEDKVDNDNDGRIVIRVLGELRRERRVLVGVTEQGLGLLIYR